MVKPILSSNQESVIEELIQSSFGAQFLYKPEHFNRKGLKKEPCDLFWYGNDVLVLFYLTAGNQTLQKQDEHNLKQIRKWNSHWDRNNNLSLTGINRYGDNLSIKQNDAKYIINISLIGHRAGIVFHNFTTSRAGFTCTIPESLIHSIAAFHGTVVDLLSVIQVYSLELQRHLKQHTATAPERLELIVKQKLAQLQSTINRSSSIEDQAEDLAFIHGIIEQHKLPDPFGNALTGGVDINPREMMSTYFSDLSANDFMVIAVVAKEAIKKTDGGKITVTASTNGLHTNWVIFATELGINNFKEIFEESRKSLKLCGRDKLPQIIYGHPRNIGDYRSPLAIAFDEKNMTSQTEKLTRLIIDRLNVIFPNKI